MAVGDHTWYGIAQDITGTYENHTLTSDTFTIEAGVTSYLSLIIGKLCMLLPSTSSRVDLIRLGIIGKGGRLK